MGIVAAESSLDNGNVARCFAGLHFLFGLLGPKLSQSRIAWWRKELEMLLVSVGGTTSLVVPLDQYWTPQR
jgi:hypothetical protein